MQYETIDHLNIPKIGMGSARLGGRLLADRSREAFYLSAVRSALDLGYTHFDTAELYGRGHAEELIGRAVHESGIGRETLFLTTKVWPVNLAYGKVLRACENSLRRLGMEYVDLYLIHWPNPFVPLSETFRALNQLVRQGKVKHVGICNSGVKRLRQCQTFSETPIFADQVPYSLTHRAYTENGVLQYCQENNIVITAYTPVNHGHIAVDAVLQSVAEAHHASPYQIALAWLTNQRRVITIPLSFDAKHQKENLAAADIVLTPSEMSKLAQLR